MISNGINLKCYRRVSHKKSSSKSNRRFLNFKRYHSNIVNKRLKLELENEPAQNKKVSFYKYNTICLTNFLKTNLTEFAVIWVKKHKKAGFLSPISSKITLTKEKERRKQRSEGKERRKREESNGRILGFYNSYFGDGFWPKKKTVGLKRSIWRLSVFKNPAWCILLLPEWKKFVVTELFPAQHSVTVPGKNLTRYGKRVWFTFITSDINNHVLGIWPSQKPIYRRA